MVFGLFVVLNPMETIKNLVIICGCFLFIFGIFYLFAFTDNRQGYFRPGWILSQGLLSLLMGVLFIFKSSETITVISLFFGLWAVFTGVVQIAASIQIKALEFKRWWWVIAGGVINIVFGFLMVTSPWFVSTVIVTLFGVYIIFLGINTIIEFFVYR